MMRLMMLVDDFHLVNVFVLMIIVAYVKVLVYFVVKFLTHWDGHDSLPIDSYLYLMDLNQVVVSNSLDKRFVDAIKILKKKNLNTKMFSIH